MADGNPSTPQEPVTIELDHPIQVGKMREPLTELTLRPVKGKDLRRLKTSADNPIPMALELAGYISGQPTQVIDELCGNDLTEVLRVTSDFFGGTPETGDDP
jgi:hypothetical protein